MITYDLACEKGHRFEGWFRNREDFGAQLEDEICRRDGPARRLCHATDQL